LDRVAGLRDEYTRAGLAEADASADPVGKFRAWFEDALAANVREPSAATLATSDGKPSARVVLLKGHDRRGSVSCRRHQLGTERGRTVGGLRCLLNGLRSGVQAGPV
jgi:pyridoxine/pyridoxamine 5'-phosphate oxidase